MPLTVRAPAKINLHLRVLPAGGDGFHPLRSWFRTIDLFDELSTPASGGNGRSAAGTPASLQDGSGVDVRLTCSDPTIPTGEENLVTRALHGLLGRGDIPLPLHLEKRIPAGAGLGGGSSDAAAALALASKLVPARATYVKAVQLALDLGADIPFFVLHQFSETITDATCTGRGNEVRPFSARRPYGQDRHVVLLMLPGIHVSTPAVYARFDELPAPPDDGSPDFAEWSRLSSASLLPKLRNDLEPAAFSLHPELASLRAQAEQALGRPVRMTGSGSALFTLYDSPRHAADAEALHRLRDLPLTPRLA